MTQAAASPPQLALTGANPSPSGQTQEQTPGDTGRGGNKTRIETQAQCVKGMRSKTFPPAVQAVD